MDSFSALLDLIDLSPPSAPAPSSTASVALDDDEEMRMLADSDTKGGYGGYCVVA